MCTDLLSDCPRNSFEKGYYAMLARLWSALALIAFAGAAHAQTYTYDQRGRVTQVQYPNGAKVNYTYDLSGNRTAVAVSSATNRPPTALADTQWVAKTSQFTIDPRTNDSDPDGHTLSVTSVNMPSCGSVVQNGNNVTFTAAGCNTGPANFTYGITDSAGGKAWARVNITVTD